MQTRRSGTARGGGIAGRKVELAVEDTESNPAAGARKLRSLIQRRKASFIVGSVHSGIMLASIPIATELKTPYFSCGEATEATGTDRGSIARLRWRWAARAGVLAVRAAKDRRDAKKQRNRAKRLEGELSASRERLDAATAARDDARAKLRAEIRAELRDEMRMEAARAAAAEAAEIAKRRIEASVASGTVNACIERVLRSASSSQMKQVAKARRDATARAVVNLAHMRDRG